MAAFVPRRSRNFNMLSLLPVQTNPDGHAIHDQTAFLRPPSSPNLASSPIRKYHLTHPPRRRWASRLRISGLRLTFWRVLCTLLFLYTSITCLRSWTSDGSYITPHTRLYHWLFPPKPFVWESFPKYTSYYNGVKALVRYDDYFPENDMYDPNNLTDPLRHAVPPPSQEATHTSTSLPLSLIPFNPYPNYTSPEYLEQHPPVHKCYLDDQSQIAPPDIYAYPGVPQNMPHPIFGSYKELGFAEDVCFDRYGRFSAYGWGYSREEGGLWAQDQKTSDYTGVNELWQLQPKINYALMDWGSAQRRCRSLNKERFRQSESAPAGDGQSAAADDASRLPRTAFVLRAFTGYVWTDFEVATIRALISELALKSGGEYDVHLLVDVKDETIPLWASPEVHQRTMEMYVPREFWGITTMWSMQLMKLFYPGPFTPTVDNNSGEDIYGTFRSGHWALQWFAQQHPEYDFVWNWEMDVRYTGHYYELVDKVGAWARKQPRKGLWERSAKYWIPSMHGDYATNFTALVEQEIEADVQAQQQLKPTDPSLGQNPVPIWGPVPFAHSGLVQSPAGAYPETSYASDDYQWGVGEDADLIVFNPLFNPNQTNWFFRNDITGYNEQLPVPPRRSAIVTVARLSRRLLTVMHNETYQQRHTAFPEMWPATAALHHGLKAVQAPHPVYLDREWPPALLDRTFNYPAQPTDSPFGSGEHNQQGSSFYFNADFPGGLWRRWVGGWDRLDGGGGEGDEERYAELEGSGRLCLRTTLLHPIKME